MTCADIMFSCHFNSSDGETFISTADLRINMWNLEISNKSFTIVDVKPANMEDLTGGWNMPAILHEVFSSCLSWSYLGHISIEHVSGGYASFQRGQLKWLCDLLSTSNKHILTFRHHSEMYTIALMSPFPLEESWRKNWSILKLLDLYNAIQGNFTELKISIQEQQMVLKKGDDSAIQITTRFTNQRINLRM